MISDVLILAPNEVAVTCQHKPLLAGCPVPLPGGGTYMDGVDNPTCDPACGCQDSRFAVNSPAVTTYCYASFSADATCNGARASDSLHALVL